MADTVYRFLPWTRRGLAAALPDQPAGGAPLPPRATVAVKVVVGGAGEASTSAVLHGPGDVIGIDPTQIVRTYPRPYTTNAEANYLAAVDLDAPELPWLFTPGGVPSSGKLPPWVVLVVVEDRAGVRVLVPPGAPLPQLRIESGAGAELPDLADAWAWAHVQLVESAGGATPGEVAQRLGAAPNRNVARLVCPRRLVPQRRWIAALVPAYDAGRVRGLGGTPVADAPLGPAWQPTQDSVTLPVYFHWEFQTGAEGDFESLAQRLKPHKADTTVGLVPMHVGDAAPPLRVPPDQVRHLPMDGALRAPAQSDGRLDEVPAALRAGLRDVTRTLADAADGVLDGETLEDASRQPVGPPVYASSHVRRWRVLDGDVGPDATWFRELNLDPRARVAAGLGAECVRANQEEIANAAWQQVGDIMAAEAALQRAALSKLVATSFFRRHVEPLAAAALLPIAGPIAARTPVGAASLVVRIAGTSLPDAVVDSGLRRALAPSARAVARAARRLRIPTTAVRTGLVASLAHGRADLDATRFDRPALSGVDPDAFGSGDLSAIGLPVAAPPETLTRLAAAARHLAEGRQPPETRLALRPQVRTEGLLGQAHVEAARRLAGDARLSLTAPTAGAPRDQATIADLGAGALLDTIVVRAGEALAASPDGSAVGFLLEGPVIRDGALVRDVPLVSVGVLDVDAGNTLVVRTGAGLPNRPVAVLDANLSGRDLASVLARLPANVLRPPAAADAVVDRRRLPVVRAGGVPPGPPLVDPGALQPHRGRTPVLPAAAVAALRPPGAAPVAVPDPVVDRFDRFDRLHRLDRPDRPDRPEVSDRPPTVVVPPLIRSPEVIGRFEAALAEQRVTTAIAVPPPRATLVAFDLEVASVAVRTHLDPVVAQPRRRDARLAFAARAIGSWRGIGEAMTVDGWWASHALDRIMAYPTFPVPASTYLSTYDRTRFCPGIDSIPTDSVTLLETNPRFIAAFMAGLNHETNRELLWRGFPTDSRGTPFRRFWRRLDGNDDIPPIHGWRLGTLAEQTTDPKGNLVLLLRGDLLRRYPNTIVVALPALGERQPDHTRVLHPVFAGQFDPDASFFGFPLVDTDLEAGQGWFFALMEPVTEPRFGLDETKGAPAAGAAAADLLAWTDTGVAPGAHLGPAALAAIGVTGRADDVAAALFQRPFALYVHAKHLVNPLPVQH